MLTTAFIRSYNFSKQGPRCSAGIFTVFACARTVKIACWAAPNPAEGNRPPAGLPFKPRASAARSCGTLKNRKTSNLNPLIFFRFCGLAVVQKVLRVLLRGKNILHIFPRRMIVGVELFLFSRQRGVFGFECVYGR